MWTKTLWVVTLCVLFYGKQMSASDTGAAVNELQAQLGEAVVARNVAEQRCAELKASLTQLQKDFEALRGRYADLLVNGKQREAETEQLRLEIAKLLLESGEDRDSDLTARAVGALREIHEANTALYTGIRLFCEYLPGVIDALEPSVVIRREIGERLHQLKQLAVQAERLPSSVAGRGGKENRSHRECRVLALSDEYQIVILDTGAVDGARLGMLWSVQKDDQQPTHVLRLVEIRPTLSAAMVIKGNLDSIAPGTLVKAGGANSD